MTRRADSQAYPVIFLHFIISPPASPLGNCTKFVHLPAAYLCRAKFEHFKRNLFTLLKSVAYKLTYRFIKTGTRRANNSLNIMNRTLNL